MSASPNLNQMNIAKPGMKPNYTLERTGVQRGRAVLAMDGVLGGADRAAVAGRSPKR
jgi:hypothetical protein